MEAITKQETIPVLYSQEEIQERIEALADEIAQRMNTQDLMIICLLRGSFIFAADLVRELYRVGVQPQVDFMTVSSYSGTESTGNITVHRDIRDDVKGRTVLILDDILETGRTISAAKELIQQRGAADIKVAMLLDKPGKRDKEIEADFVGFTIADRFVVGYGLDYDNHFRELPFIGYIEIH